MARNQVESYGHDIAEADMQDVVSHAIMRVAKALKRHYDARKAGWKAYCKTVVVNDVCDQMAKLAKLSRCVSIEGGNMDVSVEHVDVEQVAMESIGDPVLLEIALGRIRGEHATRTRSRLHLDKDEYNAMLLKLHDLLTGGTVEET